MLKKVLEMRVKRFTCKFIVKIGSVSETLPILTMNLHVNLLLHVL